MAAVESVALAVRIRVVARYLGELLVGIAFMVGVAGAFAALVGDYGFAARCGAGFVVVAGIALGCRRLPAVSVLQVNESLLVVALTFIVGAASMVWPLAGSGLGVGNAVFESVSGLTTTGLSTVAHPEHQSAAFLFARAWMQWCGGLVIVVLALALIVEPGPAARALYGVDEGTAGMIEGTRMRARRALVIYTVLLVVGVLLLWLLGATPFEALVYSLSSVSTGGFSTGSGSIASLAGYPGRVGVTLLTVCGAVSLSAWPRTVRGDWRRLFFNTEIQAVVAMGAVATCLLVAALVWFDGQSLRHSLALAPLLAFSAQTTSGFEATRVANLDTFAKLILIACMFAGGSLGSTAGGIKMGRLLAMLRLVRYLLQRTRITQHAVLDVESGSAGFDQRAAGVPALISLFVMVIAVSWAIFLALGFDPMNSLFEIVSAIGTVGLSSGITSDRLDLLPKSVLCVDMLMGRLEIVAVLLLFYPATWRGKKAEVS